MFEEFMTFCAMGGYGKYVWPCYALLLILIIWHIVATVRRDVSVHRNLKQDFENSRDQQTKT